MKDTKETTCPGVDFKCPECRRPLSVPRTRSDAGQVLVCGGCGRRFECDELPPAPSKD